jgi:hypothetical protein
VDPRFSVESYDLSGAFLGTDLRDFSMYPINSVPNLFHRNGTLDRDVVLTHNMVCLFVRSV